MYEPQFFIEVGSDGEFVVMNNRDGERALPCVNLENQPLALDGYSELVKFNMLAVMSYRNPQSGALRICIKLKNCDTYCRP